MSGYESVVWHIPCHSGGKCVQYEQNAVCIGIDVWTDNPDAPQGRHEGSWAIDPISLHWNEKSWAYAHKPTASSGPCGLPYILWAINCWVAFRRIPIGHVLHKTATIRRPWISAFPGNAQCGCRLRSRFRRPLKNLPLRILRQPVQRRFQERAPRSRCPAVMWQMLLNPDRCS